MAEPAADRLVPPPASGRIFTADRRVRFGDVNPAGRARLDALSTYVQDVASDDTADLGVGGDLVWVVRRTAVDYRVGPRFLEDLTLATWCSGLGRRWAERRVSLRGTGSDAPPGASGARVADVEVAVLWVALDRATNRPVSLPPAFVDAVEEAAGGRHVSARLQHPGSPPAVGAGRHVERWALRATDFDLLGHVNNAAAWAMVEEAIAELDHRRPFRAEIEYRLPVEPGAEVELVVDRRGADDVWLWARGYPAGASRDAPPVVFTTARVVPLVAERA